MQKSILHRSLPAAFALCLAVFVLGARWAVFDRFGMDLPEWDQWDAEGLNLLAPWFAHDHFLRALFTPHNEHRVVLTKLINLGLTLANGQWDQRLEAVVNAFLPASIAAALFLLAHRNIAAFTLAPLWLFLAAAFGLPFAWQNILGGFHSQQFLLVGLAFVTLALLPFARPFSARWWWGAAAAALGLLSMASGFFAAVVVIGLLGLHLLRRETTLRSATPTIALCAIIAAVGWFTRHEVEYHAALKAQSFSDFAFTIIRSLQWPAPLSPWFALVMWLPWTWLLIRVLRPVAPTTPALRNFGYLVIGLGGWVLLQFLATGYARGAGGPPPASRYIDTVVFGLVANALTLACLASSNLSATRPRMTLGAVTAAWTGLFLWGGTLALRETLVVELPPVKVYHDYARQNVRNYLLTGDVAHLNHDEIPYPGADSFLVRLNIESLRSRLPASVRPPLPLAAAQSTFLSSKNSAPPPATGLPLATPPLEHRPSWGSFSATPGDSSAREFTSVSLRAPLGGYLRFDVVGHVGEPDVTLELRDARTGALLSRIASDKIPGDAWRGAFVPAPSGSFVVYARAPDNARWLAFSQPIEMARGSFWAWQISKHGLLVAEIALGVAAVSAGLALLMNRRRSAA